MSKPFEREFEMFLYNELRTLRPDISEEEARMLAEFTAKQVAPENEVTFLAAYKKGMSGTDDRFFVVAPSYQYFSSWCEDKKINPSDRSKAIFVRDMRDVQGHILTSKKQIVDLGEFDLKRYELVLALKSRIKERK